MHAHGKAFIRRYGKWKSHAGNWDNMESRQEENIDWVKRSAQKQQQQQH